MQVHCISVESLPIPLERIVTWPPNIRLTAIIGILSPISLIIRGLPKLM